MNPSTKFAMGIGAGFIVFLLLLLVAGSVMNGLQDQPTQMGGATGSELVGEQLWIQNNFSLIILAVMMFAGVLGVLALVGGDLKWH